MRRGIGMIDFVHCMRRRLEGVELVWLVLFFRRYTRRLCVCCSKYVGSMAVLITSLSYTPFSLSSPQQVSLADYDMQTLRDERLRCESFSTSLANWQHLRYRSGDHPIETPEPMQKRLSHPLGSTSSPQASTRAAASHSPTPASSNHTTPSAPPSSPASRQT